MKKTFEFEYDDELGREWLNKDNMQLLCNKSTKGKSLIKVVQEVDLIKQRIGCKGTVDVLYVMLVIDPTIKKVSLRAMNVRYISN